MPSGRRQVGGCGRGLGGPVLSEPQSPRLLAERWAWVAGMMGNQLHGGGGGGVVLGLWRPWRSPRSSCMQLSLR